MWTSPSPSFDQVMSEFLLHFASFQVGGWKLEADFGKKEKGNIRSCVILKGNLGLSQSRLCSIQSEVVLARVSEWDFLF